MKVESIYTIEIINDKKSEEKFLRCFKEKVSYEPWECYTVKHFGSLSDAMTYYMTWCVSPDCFDIKMFNQIVVDGKVEYEDYLEPKTSVFYLMKQMICKDEYEKNKKLEYENFSIKAELKLYRNFTSKIGVYNTFCDYVKGEDNEC